jgi:hypothetical protein
VVAWFIGVESGRMEFHERGDGNLHLLVDLPVGRDGRLKDLLDGEKRRDCRFAAVICENAERLARVTYFGAKVEYELARHGIEVFAADEGGEAGRPVHDRNPTYTGYIGDPSVTPATVDLSPSVIRRAARTGTRGHRTKRRLAKITLSCATCLEPGWDHEYRA